jgi:hypothetical protein
LVKAISSAQRLDIAPFSHPLRTQLLGDLTTEQLYEGMHLVAVDGSTTSAAAAFAQLVAILTPGTGESRLLVRIGRGKAAPFVILRFYGVISRHRGFLARFVPDAAPVERVTKQGSPAD